VTKSFFLEGESPSYLYFVLEGWFKAEKVSMEGRQQTLRLIGPGEEINELAIFSGEKCGITVIAMEDAQVFALSQPIVEELLRQNSKFSRAIIKNLTERIQHLVKQVENLSLYSVEVRLARLLLQESKSGIFERPQWKTQTEIASQLGTVLDVVNRNLNKFAKQGLIEIDRNQIRIIDANRLENIARG
jgi:CRP/FNR family transcriptional regulator